VARSLWVAPDGAKKLDAGAKRLSGFVPLDQQHRDRHLPVNDKPLVVGDGLAVDLFGAYERIAEATADEVVGAALRRGGC
jgi:hypothetical protein